MMMKEVLFMLLVFDADIGESIGLLMEIKGIDELQLELNWIQSEWLINSTVKV